jgi:tetratricopeptide (TPR) repeat protein
MNFLKHRPPENEYNKAMAYYGTARALIAHDRNEEALEYLRKAIEVHPEFAEAHYYYSATLDRVASLANLVLR